MVQIDGKVYLKAGRVTIWREPVGTIEEVDKASSNQLASMALIALYFSMYNDMSSKGEVIH